jgi:hypothetical protein
MVGQMRAGRMPALPCKLDVAEMVVAQGYFRSSLA